jgi:hypothetical protein
MDVIHPIRIDLFPFFTGIGADQFSTSATGTTGEDNSND